MAGYPVTACICRLLCCKLCACIDVKMYDRNGDAPYQCGTSAFDIHVVANVERPVPAEWITEDGCGLNDGYEKYARPLIMGELQPLFVNGLPRHLVRK